jgi:hypothetical protein
MQAIANTAGLHFAYIEQGGSSLYSTMALKASSLEVLLIVVSIGGVETNYFSLWHDKAGNAIKQPLAGVVDPKTKLGFPNLNEKGGELNRTNLILPEPTQFISRDLPACSWSWHVKPTPRSVKSPTASTTLPSALTAGTCRRSGRPNHLVIGRGSI